jgi:6-phosphofructokinase 1
VSHRIAAQLEALTHIECRVTILGHLLRGGSPSAHDRMLAMRFGIEAVHLVADGNTGRMVSLRGNEITSIPISEVAGKQRKVTPDHPWIKAANSLGICLGAPLEVPLEEYVS